MTNLKTDLLSLITQIDKKCALPRVKQIFVPTIIHAENSEEKFAKFGLLRLEDDSCGFFYTQLDNTLDRLWDHYDLLASLTDVEAVSLAKWYTDTRAERQSLGMAAINAISHHIFKSYCFFDKKNTESKKPKPKHLGMVGFFPPLVRKFRNSGQRLTVIERKAEFVEISGNLEVTLDPSKLSDCDEILCTASTLLNESLEEVLSHCPKEAYLSLIGPTAGCLPDPLFARGIDEVGASRVLDVELLMQRMNSGEPWGESVVKYNIRREEYPGLEQLMS